mmetsp:Transcript_28542/g.73778  ORF Transcript_28542/g.73778 Transcript_28542/m.73778 type:complete len:215 (+) Transcript_28542:463-1107(+)
MVPAELYGDVATSSTATAPASLACSCVSISDKVLRGSDWPDPYCSLWQCFTTPPGSGPVGRSAGLSLPAVGSGPAAGTPRPCWSGAPLVSLCAGVANPGTSGGWEATSVAGWAATSAGAGSPVTSAAAAGAAASVADASSSPAADCSAETGGALVCPCSAAVPAALGICGSALLPSARPASPWPVSAGSAAPCWRCSAALPPWARSSSASGEVE